MGVPYRIGVFANLRRTSCQDIGRVKLGVHRVRLTGIDHEKDFIISWGFRVKKKSECLRDVGRYRFF
jgi:hypothetical protein